MDSLFFVVVLLINLIPILFIFVINNEELKLLKNFLPKAWLIAGFIVSLFSGYELITQNHFPGSLQERGGGDFVNALPYAAGFHGNYNDFSLFLFFCIAGMLLKENSSFKNEIKLIFFAKWALVFFIFIVILLNGSRAAIVSISFLLSYYFIRTNSLGFVYFLTSLLLILYFVFLSAMDYLNMIFMFLELKFTDFSSDLNSDGGRLALINAGIKGILETYGAGVGAGASTAFFANSSTVVIPNPHNLILEWVLNFGILGLFIFFMFFLKILVNATNKSLGLSRFIVQAVIITLPIWGVIQSHLLGFTYFWLVLFTIIVFVLRENNSAVK
jgi:O-antigen ligase